VVSSMRSRISTTCMCPSCRSWGTVGLLCLDLMSNRVSTRGDFAAVRLRVLSVSAVLDDRWLSLWVVAALWGT
jgi:hypothetical protein